MINEPRGQPLFTRYTWQCFYVVLLVFILYTYWIEVIKMTWRDLLMNAFFHLYLAFYVIVISPKILYFSIAFILIYILEARCTHTGDSYCTQYCIVFFAIFFNCFYHLFNFISWPIYLFLLPLIYLFILLVPHNCFNCYLRIVLFYCILWLFVRNKHTTTKWWSDWPEILVDL